MLMRASMLSSPPSPVHQAFANGFVGLARAEAMVCVSEFMMCTHSIVSLLSSGAQKWLKQS